MPLLGYFFLIIWIKASISSTLRLPYSTEIELSLENPIISSPNYAEYISHRSNEIEKYAESFCDLPNSS